ncbi:MAG TPA: alcohol dehydrogenase catalytic domain-containing protein [Candidatus Anaerostipes avistercoris]|uniref:Alcohol dehydrogenase catalytic domain-containing protein n=1 Tax=Candidatus Anaerostipes avistercoris TaxID=2838462 RepID=A0A9D2T8G3_9FIRM|nr:alcohol dehydrogenase catalytic domain-containing protein [Candidatus Anaerostipes avistercoris]
MDGMAKTLVFTGERQIELREYPIPEVSDDKVLVKVDACAICTWEQRVYTGVKKVEYPFIGGHEMVGKIIGMGKNVDRRQWSEGDFVAVGVTLPCKNCYQCKSGNEQNCENFDHSKQQEGLPEKGMGGMSSHLLVSPDNLFHIDHVSPEEATITEPLSCVLHSVETAQIEFGDTVVVIGCGIMGLLHTLLSIRRGACVIVSDTNEERTKLALELGASYAVNPSKEDLEEKVKEITGGIKAQVVFDTTPISAVAEDAVKSVANNGRLVLYSSFYPDTPISISPDWLHKSAAKLLGTANSNTVDFTRATRLLSQGIIDVKPFVSEVYELEEYKQAFESAIKGDKFRVVIKF